MKTVVQLDDQGYFVGTTLADESPLEPGVFLLPAGAVDADIPVIPSGKRVKWSGGWRVEDLPLSESTLPEPISWTPTTYAEMRMLEYPPMADYLDGVVKGDQVQIDAYIATCLAVKAKYPKPADEVAPLDSDA